MMENNQPIKTPWGIRDLIWAGMFVTAFVVAMNVIYFFASQSLASFARPRGARLIGFVIAQDTLLLGAAWLFSVARYRVGWDALGLRAFDARAGLKRIAGLLALSYGVRLCYGALMLGLGVKPAPQDVLARLDTTGWSAALTFFAVALFAPVVEEIFFRGFVYGGLRGRVGARGANIISALIFTALHFTLDQFVSILVLGLILAWLYEKTGSLIPGIILHAINNGLALVALLALKGAGALPM